MKISSLKPGQIVYDVGRRKMGNTTATTVFVWGVHIIEVADDGRSVRASWNGNPPRPFFQHEVSRWRLSKPVLIQVGWTHRLANREELKAMKAAAQSNQQDAA